MKSFVIGISMLLFMGMCPDARSGFKAMAILAYAEGPQEEIPWEDKIEFHGDMWTYYIYQNNPYFVKDLKASFIEPTVRLAANIHPVEGVDIDVRGVLSAVRGDSFDLTFADDEMEAVADLWNISLKDLFDKPLTLKVGRQEIGFGDGFLIWDGVTDKAAVWSTPLRSFFAARLTYAAKPITLDMVAAFTEEDFLVYDGYVQGYQGRSGLFGGNAHLEKKSFGVWDFGVFYRDDASDLDNDTLAISLRGEYTIPFFPLLAISGEIVKEYGDTRLNQGALSGSSQERDAWGGHLDATLSFKDTKFSPYIKGSFIYLGGDDPNTSQVEAYDPLFFGWLDWSKWWIGSITSWELVATNEKVRMLEVGITPTQTTQLRIQLFDFNLAEEIIPGAGRDWSREINAIVDWFPNKWFFSGVALNYARPGKAAAAFNGDRANVLEFVMWAGVSF